MNQAVPVQVLHTAHDLGRTIITTRESNVFVHERHFNTKSNVILGTSVLLVIRLLF